MSLFRSCYVVNYLMVPPFSLSLGNWYLFNHLGIIMIPYYLNFILKVTITFSRSQFSLTLAFYGEIIVMHKKVVVFRISIFLYTFLIPVPLLGPVTLIILESDVDYSYCFSCE